MISAILATCIALAGPNSTVGVVVVVEYFCPKSFDRTIGAHPLCDQAEDSDGRDEKHEVVELSRIVSTQNPGCHEDHFCLTAFLEYSFSSASVRASTNKRRKLGNAMVIR